jgi:DNA-binding IclR family transcriptional regulator
VAVASRQWPEPVTSVAVPITGARDKTIAAVSVVASSEHVAAATLRPAVVAIGRAISRAVSAGPMAAGSALDAVLPRPGA